MGLLVLGRKKDRCFSITKLKYWGILEIIARWCSGSTNVFGAFRVGSNPARVTIRRLAQLVRALGLHPRGHRFESYISYDNWEYRIAAIAVDCKSTPSGS